MRQDLQRRGEKNIYAVKMIVGNSTSVSKPYKTKRRRKFSRSFETFDVHIYVFNTYDRAYRFYMSNLCAICEEKERNV